MADVPVDRKPVRSTAPWLDAPVVLPWLGILARLLAGGYGAASFLFFAISPEATLRRALVENALTDSEQNRLTAFLGAGMLVALAHGARALRRGREAVARASWEAFVAAPLALFPLYEGAPSFTVRCVAIAALVALAVFALHRFATRTTSGAVLDRLDARSMDRAGPALSLILGLVHGCAVGWFAARRLEIAGAAIGTRALVFANAVAVGAAAIAVYGIARRRTAQPGVSLLLAVAYLLHPAIPGIADDTHSVLPFAALFLGFVWAMETEPASRRRTTTAVALFAAALFARRDAGLALAAWCSFLLLERKRIPVARSLLAISLVAFIGVAAVGGAIDLRLVNVLHYASELGSVNERWELFAIVLFPVIGLPFVMPRSALLVVPALLVCLLGVTAATASIDHPSTGLVLPILFVATIVAATRFPEPRTRTVLAIGVVLSTCLVTAKVASDPLLGAPRAMRALTAEKATR